MDFQKNLIPKTIEKAKNSKRLTMLFILFTLFGFVVGFAVCATYAGFSSTAESNGTLTFAVNGHRGTLSLANTKVAEYESTDLLLEFTLASDTNYTTPTISGITMGGVALTQSSGDFKTNANVIVATYSAPILMINRANVSGDLVITGSSTADTYTITYNSNGGTGTMANSTPSYNSVATLRANTFTRTGYTFWGWALTSSGEVKYVDQAEVKDLGSKTLYAKWLANELTFDNQNKSTTFSTVSQNITFTGASSGTGTYTYDITAGNDESYFSVSGTSLTVVASTPIGMYNVAITATDTGSSKTRTAIIAITINPITLGTPVVSVSTAGVVTWGAITGASSYDISIDGTTWTTGVSSGLNYFSTIVAGTGSRTVRIRANPSANYDASKIGTASITVYGITVAGANGTVRVSRTSTAGSATTLNFITGTTAYIFATANANYHFVNWTKNAGNAPASTTTANTSLTVNSTATHTANFVIDTRTVTYNATTNGGTTSATTATVNHGSSADLSKNASKSGWSFVGWNTSSSATTALGSYTVTSNVTLYAIFSRVLTMNYNNNGTTGSVSVTIYNTATSGASNNLPAVAGRSGWNAYGWSTSTAANNSRVDSNTAAHSISITTSTTGGTYYATYSRTLTLSYNANGGSSTPNSQTTTQYYNSAGNTSSHSFTLASAISRAQDAQYTYSFSSWGSGSASGTGYNAGASVTLSDNTTFYAKWSSSIRYYTVSGFGANKSYAYGTILQVGVYQLSPPQVRYGLYDSNGNLIEYVQMYVSDCPNIYVNGVRYGGMGSPSSGSFTVTCDCNITFGA